MSCHKNFKLSMGIEMNFSNRSNVPIYLVSLESDLSRREQLKILFPRYYAKFHHVPAVDGRELTAGQYYKQTTSYFIKHNKTMSPAELGCTLSHIKALKAFLETNDSYALILEDDVMGSDKELEEVLSCADSLDNDSLLLCGAQDGVDRRYQLGKLNKNKNLYEVHAFSHEFMLRTCCYVVTRTSAKNIINHHHNNLTLADKWDVFFKHNNTRMFYVEILKHPIDLTNSHIEADRAQYKEKSLLRRLLTKDIIEKIFFKIKNEIYRVMIMFNGYDLLSSLSKQTDQGKK